MSKLLFQEQSHANMLDWTKHCYNKAKKVNLDRHTWKTTTENQKTNTAVARAAQAAANIQMAQNVGHFPNPRGVDLIRRVSFCSLFKIFTHFFVTNKDYCRYLTSGYGRDAD
jgi:hypothetical protein